jgi:hypothetical protein
MVGEERIHLRLDHGPTALVEVRAGGTVTRAAVLLREAGRRDGRTAYRGGVTFPGALELRLRAEIGPDAALPGAIDVTARGTGGAPWSAALRPGERVMLPGGAELALNAVRYWSALEGSRDPSTPLAYAGFALALAGACLMCFVVRVDSAVIVTPTEAGERVLVALRPRRLAPLFAQRFEAFAREQQGDRAGSNAPGGWA